jgi:hypothetical protein
MGMLSYHSETPERLAHATAVIGAAVLERQQFLSALAVSVHDTVTLDAATDGGIKEVRQFNNTLLMSPQFGEVRLGVIIQADALSLPAQNALLKLLEEPPQSVKIILFINREQAVLPTILSRCRCYYTTSAEEKNEEVLLDTRPLDQFLLAEEQAKNDQAITVVMSRLRQQYQAWRQNGYHPADYPQIETMFRAYCRLHEGVNARLILESRVLSSGR